MRKSILQYKITGILSDSAGVKQEAQLPYDAAQDFVLTDTTPVSRSGWSWPPSSSIPV